MLGSFVAVLVAVLGTWSEAVRLQSNMRAYEKFRKDFSSDRSYNDHSGYMARAALFEQRRTEVELHNAKPGITWIAAVNKFADYTEAEFQAMLGHRLAKRVRGDMPANAPPSSFLQAMPSLQLAEAVDWSLKMSNTSRQAKDQGGCGSCWAVASAGALEAHAEVQGGSALEVSYEQLVDCVPNPHECGGTGGCEGATSELALEWVQQHGIAVKTDYHGYQSGDGAGTCKPVSRSALTSQGYVRLPENKLQPLLEAIATKGPVVVSADAGFWGLYSSGVFDDCTRNAVINHAILMMGYGSDKDLEKDFWLIRNSWGDTWGEHGYIRLLRHGSAEEYCGVDKTPLNGVGCKDGPKTLPVCGMCGILSDSAYPTGVQLVQI